ncbi:MAG: hypothetical protein QOC79_2547, partial [Actinomycetota bacterium]|nr:hypothetical protein [Actinomycetota bacterium]
AHHRARGAQHARPDIEPRAVGTVEHDVETIEPAAVERREQVRDVRVGTRAVSLERRDTDRGERSELAGVLSVSEPGIPASSEGDKEIWLALRASQWAGLDSNQRSGNAMGLQPIPFGHSGTDPDLI